jgi:predicted acyl esterase
MKPVLRATTLFFLCLTVIVSDDAAQQEQKENYVKAHYTKYEYRIPMRDGKRLFTAVYVPKDMSQTYPFLMERTPYSVGSYGVDRYREKLAWSEDFEKAGYIFVFQDVRGRYMSEGQFLGMSPHRDDKKSAKDVD